MKLPTKQRVASIAKTIAEKSLVLLVVVYVAVSVSRSVVKNYQINKRIENLEAQLIALEREIAYQTSLLAYYRTDTFKELKAREELGLQKPGEHVLSVPIEEEERVDSAQEYAYREKVKEEKPLPNYEKWMNYFFSS